MKEKKETPRASCYFIQILNIITYIMNNNDKENKKKIHTQTREEILVGCS